MKKSGMDLLKNQFKSDSLSAGAAAMEAQKVLSKNENLSITVGPTGENVVGTFSLPYSVVPEVLVNGQKVHSSYV